MMLLALPVIFIVGAIIAGQLNRGIYRLAHQPRAIGPWTAAHEDAPTRSWTDWVPVVGWFGLRRETSLHGVGFWVRPMLLELTIGVSFAALFWVEYNGHLLPATLADQADSIRNILVCQYAVHVLLISLMVVATFIDFDEQTIPDAITVTGTLLALAIMWFLPVAAPIIPVQQTGMPDQVGFLNFASPLAMPSWANEPTGLAIALGVLWGWCFALLDRRWYPRFGFKRSVDLFVFGVYRNKQWKWVASIAGFGAIALVAAWAFGPAESWRALLTALLGLAGGGGIVWSIRIVGKAALNKEAMGFGDVTLMGMIGAFLGWQPAVLAFFFAPFAGSIIAILQMIFFRESKLPYGPYLCLASLVVMLGWGRLWPDWAIDIFALGPILVAIFGALLILMYAMLLVMRLIKALLGIG